MGFELGALLGNIGDGAQSFESLGSWDVTSLGTNTFDVSNDDSGFQHSSDLSGFISVDSGQNGLVTYNYATSNDVYNRWWFDVSTHNIVSYLWTINASNTATESGNLVFFANSESNPISISTDYQRHRIQVFANDTDDYRVALELNAANSKYQYYIDDLLTAIDVIDLFPEWSTQLKDELFLVDHQTIGGANPSYKWGFNKKWDLPLTHVEENEALLLNQWWQDTRPLLFTFDTSDTTQQFIVTMTNNKTPMNQFSRIYHDEWQGTLELSALSTGLSF